MQESQIDAKPSLFKFPHIYIVEASAGSGKTYCLAKRYVQLLINPHLKQKEIPLNTILAITFTNKAAIEMKERILEFFKKIALDKFSDKKEKSDILDSLNVKEELARQKAFMIMDYLLKNYNFFGVQTIDSFINAILSGCAFKLDLSSSFKTKKYYTEYLSYSLDNLIDKAAQDEKIMKLFHNFLIHYLFIENKTGWFPKKDILEIIAGLYSECNKNAGYFAPTDTEPKDMFFYKKEIFKLFEELNKNIPQGANKTFAKGLSSLLERSDGAFDIDDIPGAFKNSGFAINKGFALPQPTERLWAEIREKIGQLCEMESASAYNYYINIFNKVLIGLKEISAKDDVLFLEALNKEARLLFDEQSEKFTQLPELYCRLALRFRHFLIDEFQDTSILQWKNLYLMVEDVLSGDGSLFYVGDRKQAIYRFRGGEVSLIDSVKERFKDFNLILDTLSKNYRSEKTIVEFNNTVFSQENIRRFLSQKDQARKGLDLDPADIDNIVNAFADSKQVYNEGKGLGYVKSEFIDSKDSQEAEKILRGKVLGLLEDLKKRFRLEDIAILARKNNEVELLTSWLLEKDIPVESEKTLDIRQNSYIKELISFLKFLNSPIDNLSFASFISGDIFAKASGLDNKKIMDFIFSLDLRGKKAKDRYIYMEFRNRFSKEWEEYIEEFFKSVGFVPLYELVISIFAKFRVMSNFSSYQGFFMKLLELIKDQERENSGVSGFLEFFDKAAQEDLYVDVTQSDSVKILTIHKSKGLEFGAVILPFLQINPKSPKEALVEVEGSLYLWHLKKKYADFSPLLEKLYREQYIKSLLDELNSAYVAFTRAKKELYIFTSPRADNALNLAPLLLPDKNFSTGGHFSENPHQAASQAIVQIPTSVYKDWIGALKDEFIDEGILLGRDKVLKGKALHYIFSFVGNTAGKDSGCLLKQALEKALVKFPFLDNLNEYEKTASAILEKKDLQRFFDVSDAEVYLEKEVVNKHGDTKRIDRLIVKPREAWVVDYKSAKDDPQGHYQQVAEYIEIIRGIYPKLKVRGFLIYMDSLNAEEING